MAVCQLAWLMLIAILVDLPCEFWQGKLWLPVMSGTSYNSLQRLAADEAVAEKALLMYML
jgi:hypothetical protein